MIFDVEADGLLDEATKIHVLAYEKEGSIRHTHSYEEMRKILTSAKLLIGHNIIRYDIPLLEKILNIKIKARLIDTLALSWYLFPYRILHGLDSWGKDFNVEKPPIEDWNNLTPEEYAHRCKEDVRINSKLWVQQKDKLLRLYKDKKQANRLISYLSFKMDCAREQERSRWKLDVERAKKNVYTLEKLQEEKLSTLSKVMPKVPVKMLRKRPAKPFKKDGTYSVHGVKWFALLKERNLPKDYLGEIEIVVDYQEPNPNSVSQVKDWLYSLGWEPIEYKFVREDDGSERKVAQVRVDSDEGKTLCPSVLKLIDKHKEIKELSDLSTIQHRLGIFKGFLENEKDGWLKAEISGLTNTLRFKHKVLVNLPGVDRPWGEEIRGCLIAPEGYTVCGSDMSSLEENTKKHYMFPHDPEFVKEMSKPGFDAHLDLAKFAKAISQEEIDKYLAKDPSYAYVKATRGIYKPANYACVYGVGAPKLARTTGLSLSKAKELIKVYWERNWAVKKVAEDCEVKNVDGEDWLFNPVSKFWYSLRSDKDRFSTLNQGTGVFCFDSWVREVRKQRSQLTGQFHDEIIACIKQGYEEKYEKILRSAIDIVNKTLKLNILLDIDVKFGKTYAEVH